MRAAVIEESVCIPEWVRDLTSFRRWADSKQFPQEGRVSYLNGEVWVDMSKEQIFSHTSVKTEYARVLATLAKVEKRGNYWVDGAMLTHVLADFAHVPDGIFVSRESLRLGRVSLIRGARRGFVELEGTPDMLLEVLSDSSVTKDLKRLRLLYWKAGVTEYWIVDARGDKVRFDILRHTEEGYVAVSKRSGWQASAVFGHAFKLTVQPDELGNPEYTLSVR